GGPGRCAARCYRAGASTPRRPGMKVVQKLTLAMILGMLFVLGGNGYFRVRREVALFRSDRVRDHKLVGLALGAAVAAMWRADGEPAARAMLAQANVREDKISIR